VRNPFRVPPKVDFGLKLSLAHIAPEKMALDIVCMIMRFGKYQDRMMCARSNKLPGTLHLGAACLGRHCGNDRQKTRESRRGLIRLCSIA
jgi:hypothetical protein